MTGDAASALVRRRVIYAGYVQGVGFRFTAREIARGFAVVGFVRNLPDGSVELEAEGTEGEVSRFLHAIAARMADNIHSQQVTEQPPTRASARFEILH